MILPVEALKEQLNQELNDCTSDMELYQTMAWFWRQHYNKLYAEFSSYMESGLTTDDLDDGK